ncbi:cytochrome c family protein [Elioraea sp.]|jgi:cytochrome c|uniref:c-type cytochrome n=1 Tax=Elioraea sp. TaxID=2185103 RepID=UPI0021DEE452|nr:cytochrome c family protein [Elioraea sp.]GIX10982.1 MAG: cytochrome c family protein [Elioraea sp.]
MNTMELNKIAAAILTAGILFMVTGIVGDALVHPKRLHESVLKIQTGTEAPAAAAPAPAEPTIEPIGPLLASANPENGQAIARRACGACHTFDQGGRNAVGPNLWGIVGADHAHAEGFNYSQAIMAKKGQPWTYEELNRFIANPRAYAPGTRMAFNGLANTQQRADLIAWLRTLASEPKPLP